MTYRIKGTLKLPSGQPAAGVDIEFISRRNYSPLLMDLSSIIKTTQSGAYDITLEFGEYAVVVYWGCNQPSHIGKLFVHSDTVAGLDLQTLLQQSDWQPATPEYIQQILGWLAEAISSASQANESAVAAKASELAVEADRAEVASNKEIVVNAQTDVAEKQKQAASSAVSAANSESAAASSASAASASATTASQKAALAEAAANTASQKAASAAESDAGARDAATRAENAALAMAGAILDGGQCDLSSGFYPQPLMVNGKKFSTVWYIKTGGVVGDISYDAGDKLQYTTANNGFYFRIDARDDVVSVNGEKGAVTLTAEKVGADQEGTAAALISQHKKDHSAHTPQSVGADPAGTAAAAIGALKSEQDPFPQYSDFRTGESRMFETRAQLAKRAEEYHPMDGQLVPRATDQGLLAAIIAGEVPSCPDADWLADPCKRSNYTLGDGSTTIRLPDRNGKYADTVGSVFARGDGDNAPAPGIIHGDAVRDITGGGFRCANPSTGANPPFGAFSGVQKGDIKSTSGSINFYMYDVDFKASLVVPTAPQNRPTSISQVWAAKR